MTIAINRRTLIAGIVSASALVSLPAIAQTWTPGEPFLIRIGGSQPVHPIYSISAGQKAIIEKAVPGVRVELIATQGGVENANLILAQEVEAANGNIAGAYSLYYGKFEAEGGEPRTEIMSWFPGYAAPQSIIVNSDSDITGVEDLIGRRIALGPVGSGAESVGSSVIKALGYSDDDFSNVLRTDPRQAFGALAAGNVDAVFWGTAHPAGAITEQVTTRSVEFVSFKKEETDKISEAIPYLDGVTVAAGTYDTQDADMLWPSAGVHHWIHKSVPDALVYEMTKALWENREQLGTIHGSQKLLSPEMVKSMARAVPFHPGAARYFTEIGILDKTAG